MSPGVDNTLRLPLKAVSALLSYPDAALQEHAREAAAVLSARPELGGEDGEILATFIEWLAASHLLDVQADYVETFDRSKKVSLYLFEHVYIAGTIFLLGSLVRFDMSQYTWKTNSSQLLDNSPRFQIGSLLFHVGVIFLFFGHLIGLLMPHWLYPYLGLTSTGCGRRSRPGSPIRWWNAC